MSSNFVQSSFKPDCVPSEDPPAVELMEGIILTSTATLANFPGEVDLSSPREAQYQTVQYKGQ